MRKKQGDDRYISKYQYMFPPNTPMWFGNEVHTRNLAGVRNKNTNKLKRWCSYGTWDDLNVSPVLLIISNNRQDLISTWPYNSIEIYEDEQSRLEKLQLKTESVQVSPYLLFVNVSERNWKYWMFLFMATVLVLFLFFYQLNNNFASVFSSENMIFL